MKKTILLALVLLAMALPARAEKWAVVVGIDHYQSDTITPLRYAEADARQFAATLQKSAGFPARNVFLFTGDQTGSQAPTRTNLAFRFDYLIRTMGPTDTLVVYFAGHGVEMDGQSFLLTSEADARSLLTLQQSALHARDVYGWIASSKANQVLLVVDACRNDPVQARGNGQNPMTDSLARDLTLVRTSAPAPSAQPASYATLFACSAGQRSFEWSDKGHGFFTYYLVQGLEGQAAGPDGRVTLQSLSNYVQNEVSDASNRWALQKQMPWLRYEGPGADRFELARFGSQPVAVVKPEPVAVTPPQPAVVGEPLAVTPPPPRPEPVASSNVPTSKELRVSQEAGSAYPSLRAAVKNAPYGAHIVVAPGLYRGDIEILRAVTIVGEGEVVIEGTVSTIAPASLSNLVIVGELQHPERFQLENVDVRRADSNRLGPNGIIRFQPVKIRR